MHRRFSRLVKNSSPLATTLNNPDNGLDNESKVSTVVRDEPLPLPSLKVKHVDHYYSRWSKSYKYRNTSSRAVVETIPILHTASNDVWKDYNFVIVRRYSRVENQEPTIKIVVKSEYLLKACKDVIQTWPGVSWNSDPLELDPEMFIAFMPHFKHYRNALASRKEKSEADTHVIASVDLLLSTLASDYRVTLAKIERFKAHQEITFDFLYAILVPRTLFVTKCAVTGRPRLFKLVSAQRASAEGRTCYQLSCESIDLVDRLSSSTVAVGTVQTTIRLEQFKGTIKIQHLDAYPLEYHPNQPQLRESLLKRGKKWLELVGVHHKQYSGIAATRQVDRPRKQHINGRIMIDRATFRRLNPSYKLPTPVPSETQLEAEAQRLRQNKLDAAHIYDPRYPASSPPQDSAPDPGAYAHGTLVQTNNKEDDVNDLELTDEDLILTSTIVYGFSLSDKLWLEFDVEEVRDIAWNEDAFANLVLPEDGKQLLQSLVEAHDQEAGFDDFIKGKGQGLVVNLFGPPGVGKTLSAEATSEHVRRPLYLVGGGDLGTTPAELDKNLEDILDVATAWKAIVLIDEADVFLEQRSLHDLVRNAIVAIFLRHVEYYRGILFLTTNRVRAFDEAFLSRVHVALHFHELSQASKEQVWAAFIAKLGATADVTPEQLTALATHMVNGRQIKNAARTAHSLAVSRGEKVGFNHFAETLDALAEFQKEFDELKK
ncbi:putative ATPase family associated with various cellular activities (AAA) [Lyophyllum shimeji]|uniref:ATPase family associated with various cellular activities (AAA) n=1 Tax=Lyophyllum shimeji TaxID=47721 RepID=A0A9P3PIN1_LYOSH|nr:putative ATPase family associated with various cellular activities (AAA) [Lyophyllum shimeji]